MTVNHRISLQRLKTAFTLIEVLVVVAIIALLVAILIPSLAEARDQARSAKCLANMQDMGKGVNTFAATHQGRFQIIASVATPADLVLIEDTSMSKFAYESNMPAGTQANLLSWSAVLAREGGAARSVKKNLDWGVPGMTNAQAVKSTIKKFDQLACPTDKIELGGTAGPFSPTPPPIPQNNWYYGYLSYLANTDILGLRTKDPTTGQPQGKGVWKDGVKSATGSGSADPLAGRLDKVIRPGEVMLFVDGGISEAQWAATQGNHGGLSMSIGTTGGGPGQDPRGPLLEYVDTAFKGKVRHERHRRGSVNLTYADGHGSFVRRFEDHSVNPSFESSTGAYALLPVWKYAPKVRVSPYNSGQYPAP